MPIEQQALPWATWQGVEREQAEMEDQWPRGIVLQEALGGGVWHVESLWERSQKPWSWSSLVGRRTVKLRGPQKQFREGGSRVTSLSALEHLAP